MKVTLEELRETIADGFNYSSKMAADESLKIEYRTYQAGRAGALMQVLGHLLDVTSEKVGA
jgi:hypothetical protein